LRKNAREETQAEKHESGNTRGRTREGKREMYEWRKMTPAQREEALALRKARHYPWHGPPHLKPDRPESDCTVFHIWAACYEHKPVIGRTPQRLTDFENTLLETAKSLTREVFAWCVLPNHYHLLLQTREGEAETREGEVQAREGEGELRRLTAGLGQMHGRLSYQWNGEEAVRGRCVWRRCSDRGIRSERHFWATMNYVHHNPVKHGYVKRWQDWPYSSAGAFLGAVGRKRAEEIWKEYPLLEYGKGWDEFE
jgi:putative transposase